MYTEGRYIETFDFMFTPDGPYFFLSYNKFFGGIIIEGYYDGTINVLFQGMNPEHSYFIKL